MALQTVPSFTQPCNLYNVDLIICRCRRLYLQRRLVPLPQYSILRTIRSTRMKCIVYYYGMWYDNAMTFNTYGMYKQSVYLNALSIIYRRLRLLWRKWVQSSDLTLPVALPDSADRTAVPDVYCSELYSIFTSVVYSGIFVNNAIKHTIIN